MELGEGNLEKLEQYVTQTMRDADRILFEAEIAKSKPLQEFIAMYQQIDTLEDDTTWDHYNGDKNRLVAAAQLFQDKETKAFSEKLNRFREETSGNNLQPRKWRRAALFSIMAACLAILLYVVIPKETNMAQLYVENSSWEELPSLVVKGSSDTNTKLAVEQAFKAGNYAQTIDLSHKILLFSSYTDANMLLYNGIAHLELDQYKEALASFEQLTTSDNLDYHKGYWYTAMVFLKQGDKEKTREALKVVAAKRTNYRYSQAIELLEALD